MILSQRTQQSYTQILGTSGSCNLILKVYSKSNITRGQNKDFLLIYPLNNTRLLQKKSPLWELCNPGRRCWNPEESKTEESQFEKASPHPGSHLLTVHGLYSQKWLLTPEDSAYSPIWQWSCYKHLMPRDQQRVTSIHASSTRHTHPSPRSGRDVACESAAVPEYLEVSTPNFVWLFQKYHLTVF